MIQRAMKTNWLGIPRNGIEPSTQTFKLFFLRKRTAFSIVKIELDFLMIQMTIIIYNDSFNSAAIHFVQYLSDPNRLSH